VVKAKGFVSFLSRSR